MMNAETTTEMTRSRIQECDRTPIPLWRLDHRPIASLQLFFTLHSLFRFLYHLDVPILRMLLPIPSLSRAASR